MNAKFMEYYNEAKRNGKGYCVYLLNNVLSYNEPCTALENLSNEKVEEFEKFVCDLESVLDNVICMHVVSRNENSFCYFKLVDSRKLKSNKDWLFISLFKNENKDFLYRIKYLDISSLRLKYEKECINDIEKCRNLVIEWYESYINEVHGKSENGP